MMNWSSRNLTTKGFLAGALGVTFIKFIFLFKKYIF